MTSASFFRRNVSVFLLLLSSSLNTSLAGAQTRDLAALTGQVRDTQGAAIKDAEVTLRNSSTGFERKNRSSEAGTYAFLGLPLTGQFEVSVNAAGFREMQRDKLELRAGETATVDFNLEISGQQTQVVVSSAIEGLQADSNQVGDRLDLRKIENTPVLSNRLTSLALLDSSTRPSLNTGDIFINETLFVVNGSGRRQTSYSLDNTTADDSWGRQTIFAALPFSAIQEFTILTNAASAEYGRTTAAAVNIVSKSGTNNFHGDFLGMARPAWSQANLPLSTAKTANTLAQVGGAFFGPIVADRTHFLISGEYNNQSRDSIITSPAASSSFFNGKFRQSLMLARLDHRLTDRQSLAFRTNFDRFTDSNPGDAVGGLNLPTTARTFARRTYAAALSHTSALGLSATNEARAQWQLGSPITRFTPVNFGPQLFQSGRYTSGESRVANLMNHQIQFADTLGIIKGGHSLKAGVDIINSSSGGFGQEFGGGFAQGQFQIGCPNGPNTSRCVRGVNIMPISQLTINDVINFTQSFGNASYNVKETLWALFLQDSWKIRPTLTGNLGLRYDGQTFTDDRDNFSPRVGFAWSLPHVRATVLRASYGIYYSEIRANLAAASRLNGPTGIFTYSARPGQLGFPTSLSPLVAFPAGASLPPRDITVLAGQCSSLNQFVDVAKLRFCPSALLNPYTQQRSLGIETELAPHWLLSVDYVGSHTIHIERPVDLNAPAPFIRNAPGQSRTPAQANASRPIAPVPNGYRRIVANANLGTAFYDGVQVKLNKRFSNHSALLASYTFSHAINTVEPDVPQQDPNDSNLLGSAEKARSLLDLRHRAAISGWYELPWRFTLGATAFLASGQPFNITTGVDNNADGSNSDRPVIDGRVIPRNFGRGSATYDFAASLQKSCRITEHLNLLFRVEAFNVFNHPNIYGRNGIWGDAETPARGFGNPLGGISNVGPSRQIQFSARVQF